MGAINKDDNFLNFLIESVSTEVEEKVKEEIPEYLERVVNFKAVEKINEFTSDKKPEKAKAIKEFVGLTDDKINEITEKLREEREELV